MNKNKLNNKTNSRTVVSTAFALLMIIGLLIPLLTVEASNPSNGSLNATVGTSLTWTGTATGASSPNGEATCVDGVNCDTFTLTLGGAPSDWAGKVVKVKLDWLAPATDYDFYVHKDTVTGAEVTRSADGPSITESALIDPATTGTGVYVINVVYFVSAANADPFTGTASVEASAAGPNPTPPPTSNATPPTYDNFAPPSNLGQSAGEPTIGLNWATGRAMFVASLQTLRITFNDTVSPSTATWEEKSADNTSITSFDPILFTDSSTNRTFVSQLLPAKVSLMSFTDDDGETWTPSQGSGINSGVDHQTIGGGPYAKNADGSLKGAVVRNPLITYPNAVYYASQDIGVAEIARSDDGGITFGVAVPMYDLTQCGGLHGHIKVAPDGTVYVPNKGCNGSQGVAVSEDNGLTWTIRTVPGSSAGNTDPSLGIGTDGTIYLGYANGDGKARVAVSRDKGVTWENDQNVGFSFNINNTVFSAVTAGDGDRAAYFFIGTDKSGSAGTGTDQTAPYFDGVWYGYIATTYDRGRSWVTVRATTDPIQRGVVCTNGTTCPSGTRNLLDFNDMEVDQRGRAVAGAADGCTSAACVAGTDVNGDGALNTRFDNDGTRHAIIIRQSSGLGLFSQFDPPPPVSQTTVIEDNDDRVAYSNGWHLVNDANASAGHFRVNNGQSPNFFAQVDFTTTGQNGSITYNFANSSKGGSAEVFVDGVSKGVVNYGSSNSAKYTPDYSGSVTYNGLSAGSHSLELRNISGSAYVDKFVVTNGTSTAAPASGPGQTQSSNDTLGLSGNVLKSLSVPAGTSAVSIVTETSANVPVRLILIDPSGSILRTADSVNGLAAIEMPISKSGTFKYKVVNLNVGSIQVRSTATPLIAR